MADPTVDDIAKQNPLKVLDIVKTLQKDSPTTPPISPVPKPRKNLSPVPRRENKVTPPASPIRRRTSGKGKGPGKPKPPVRRRRKFGEMKTVVEGSNTKNQEGEEGGEESGLNGVQQRLEEQGDDEKGVEERGEGVGGGDEMVDGFVILEENGEFAMEETQSDSQETPEKPESPDIPERQEKPGVPEITGVPHVPEKPDKPGVPEKPDKPGVPEITEVPRVPKGPEKPVSPRPLKPDRHDLPVPEKEKLDRHDLPAKEKPKRPELPAAHKLQKFRPTSPNKSEDGKMAEGVSADKDSISLTNQIADNSKNTEEDVPSINISKEATPERQPTPDSGEDKQAPDMNDSITRRKKKPPPMPPAPYERQPPVPLKQRKQMSLKVFSSHSVDDPSVTSSLRGRNIASVTSSLGGRDTAAALQSLNKSLQGSISTPLIDQVEEEISSEVTAPPKDNTEHIYEPVESGPTVPLRLTSRPEDASSKCSRPASLDSTTSSEASVNPASPCVGVGSGTPPALKRGSTVGSKTDVRRVKSIPTKLKSRPLSDASLELMGSYEVIPGSGGKLEDMMHTLKEYDESLQDANIYELIHACAKAMPHITSTTDLPARMPNFPDDSRSCVIHELYTTEYTYVKGVEVLSEVFKIPLTSVLLDETNNIFANVEDILAFNKGFLALLHSRLSNWGPEQCIGDIFIGMFTQSHKSMYAIYCSNYDTAELLLTQKMKKKEFEQQLQVCLTNPRVMPGLTLAAYLITPVQRITRYILLLKDILKRTSEEHPDYRNLKSALERMGELADYIDATVKESQTKKTFESLKNKVHGLADLDSPERSLVKEGQVYLKNVKKLYQCILFNDILVFAHGSSKQSKLELQLDLEAVWVEDLQDLDPQTGNEDAIEVYTPDRPYTIYTRSSGEKRLWLTKLRETIYHHLHTQRKCLRSDSCQTESRTASFVYADGRVYTGEFVDSRRHGKGIMTWPNKTVYVGDWVDDERCGEGEFTYNTGDTYRGKWADNKQNGMGELQYASNDIYRGHWKDGIRHGDGNILYANGDKFTGHFVQGQIEGQGRLKCINGVEYSGEWKHSQRHGSGTLTTTIGNVYTGDFRYNHRHGAGSMSYNNGDKYEGSWKNGVRQGHGKLTFAAGKGWYEGSWESDLRHGRGKQMYPNSDVYEGGWELNKRHGRGKLVLSTGQVFEGEFREDMINGEGEMKYNKISKYQGSWVNGMRHGSGAMVYEDYSSYNGDWRQDLRHGHGELVTKDGAVYRGLWASDKPHGKGTLHIPSASYTYNGDWVAGKRDGKGDESSQYGSYKGSWRNDMKQGYGEEKSLVGTIFEGTWEKNRKHGRGVRKMVFGTVEEQMWRSGQLASGGQQTTAVELPHISRNDY